MSTDSPSVRASFDYTSLDAETSQFVQQQTGEIRVLMKRTAQGIVEIGTKLIDVKEKLGHGRFGDWLKAEFDWGKSTANRFMNVALNFPKLGTLENLAPSALYLLSETSTPAAVREEALARAKAGESISYKKAKALKQKHAPPPEDPKLEPKPQLEPVSPRVFTDITGQPSTTPTSLAPIDYLDKGCPVMSVNIVAPPQPTPQSGSKLEIVAIHRQGQAPMMEQATGVVIPDAEPALSVPQSSELVSVPAPPGVWWQLGGRRHLLYCGDPNSPEFLGRIPEDIRLLLAFPPTVSWQVGIRARTRLIIEYLPERKDLRLFEDALEVNLLLCSDVGEMVVSCFVPSPVVLSIFNRLDRQGLLAEPDSQRCNAVIADWKKAGLKAERLS